MRGKRPHLSWDHPEKLEPSDNAWQAGLRRQQAWWRETQLKIAPGQRTADPDSRLVSTMLPRDAGLATNIWTSQARSAVARARSDLKGRPGIIQPDRLRRNLLSSQPLAFNLFGYLADTPATLLPWVRSLAPDARRIVDVRLEWAPRGERLGGSAFDAYIDYELPGAARGFIGIEVKYHEDLGKGQPKPAASKYAVETTRLAADWVPGAATRLDLPPLRQFWFNQLLAQATRDQESYHEYFEVVVACGADRAAREATDAVAALLHDPGRLRFSSIEEVVASIAGHDEWQGTFSRRYTDFTPIIQFLAPSDPRIKN